MEPRPSYTQEESAVRYESSDYQSFYSGICYSYCQTYLSVLLIGRRKWQKFPWWESEDLRVRATIVLRATEDGGGALLLALNLLPCRLLAARAALLQCNAGVRSHLGLGRKLQHGPGGGQEPPLVAGAVLHLLRMRGVWSPAHCCGWLPRACPRSV